MADQVDVRSVEALRDLKVAMVRFGERARPAVDEAVAEINRLREWLVSDRQRHWRIEVRRREGRLEEAQQHLRAVRMSGMRGDCATERRAVRIAEDAVDEARAKLRGVNQWLAKLDAEARTPLAAVRQLGVTLTTVVPQGQQQLEHLANSLERYAADGGGG